MSLDKAVSRQRLHFYMKAAKIFWFENSMQSNSHAGLAKAWHQFAGGGELRGEGETQALCSKQGGPLERAAVIDAKQAYLRPCLMLGRPAAC